MCLLLSYDITLTYKHLHTSSIMMCDLWEGTVGGEEPGMALVLVVLGAGVTFVDSPPPAI